jgi:Tol biopolymer transport system component
LVSFLLVVAGCGQGRSTSSGAATTTNGRLSFVAGDNSPGLDVVNPDGTGFTQLTNPKGGLEYDLGPEWSPDGGKIAFLRYTNVDEDGNGDYELFVAHGDGSSAINLTGDRGAGTAAWSPDGREIVFGRFEKEGGEFVSHLFVITPDGNSEHQITHGAYNDHNATWSPDGTHLVFERYMGENDIDLFSVTSDGGDLQHVTQSPGSEQEPAWSPNGERIAFVRWEGGESDLYLTDPDGTGETLLADPPGEETVGPTWSPDGTTIVFQVYRGGNWDVYSVRADGTGLSKLTEEPGDETEPEWAPDGTHIAYYGSPIPSSARDNSGTFDIYVMNPDGSNKTRLTVDAGGLGAGLSWQTNAQDSPSGPSLTSSV